MMLLEGKIVLVTGASAGIGRAVAIGCVRHGADVATKAGVLSLMQPTAIALGRMGQPEDMVGPTVFPAWTWPATLPARRCWSPAACS